VLVEDVGLGHPGTQPAKNVPHRDTQSSNARLSPALTRLNRDSLDSCRHLLSISMTLRVASSFIVQRAIGIEAHGAPRGNIGSQQRDGGQNHRYGRERDRIGGADSE